MEEDGYRKKRKGVAPTLEMSSKATFF